MINESVFNGGSKSSKPQRHDPSLKKRDEEVHLQQVEMQDLGARPDQLLLPCWSLLGRI